jgi:hypothetical protein
LLASSQELTSLGSKELVAKSSQIDDSKVAMSISPAAEIQEVISTTASKEALTITDSVDQVFSKSANVLVTDAVVGTATGDVDNSANSGERDLDKSSEDSELLTGRNNTDVSDTEVSTENSATAVSTQANTRNFTMNASTQSNEISAENSSIQTSENSNTKNVDAVISTPASDFNVSSSDTNRNEQKDLSMLERSVIVVANDLHGVPSPSPPSSVLQEGHTDSHLSINQGVILSERKRPCSISSVACQTIGQEKCCVQGMATCDGRGQLSPGNSEVVQRLKHRIAELEEKVLTTETTVIWQSVMIECLKLDVDGQD